MPTLALEPAFTVETARESLKGGAVDFVIKPFRISELRDLVVKASESGEA